MGIAGIDGQPLKGDGQHHLTIHVRATAPQRMRQALLVSRLQQTRAQALWTRTAASTMAVATRSTSARPGESTKPAAQTDPSAP